jgi:hypothetical protein
LSDKWEEVKSESVTLQSGSVKATVSIIRSTKDPSVVLVSIGKRFKSVALKPVDWLAVLPILTALIEEAKKQ